MMFDDLFEKTLASAFAFHSAQPMDFGVREIIQNYPATVIVWDDGVKTVVKCQNGEPFDAEKGIALCYMKRICGNKHDWYDTMLRLIRRAEGKKKKQKKSNKVALDNDGLLGYTCEYPTKE